MTKWWMLTPALLLVFAVPGWAMQEEDPFRQYEEEDDEDHLTPEEAMELLKEAEYLMEKAEDLLHDSSRGKALETEEELVKKLEKILQDEDPKILQRKIVEKVEKLMKKAQKKQEGARDKLAEILKKAKG